MFAHILIEKNRLFASEIKIWMKVKYKYNRNKNKYCSTLNYLLLKKMNAQKRRIPRCTFPHQFVNKNNQNMIQLRQQSQILLNLLM